MPVDPPHGGQWNSGWQYTTYTGVAVANLIAGISPQGQIIAGGNLDAASVGLFENHWSAVAAVGNIAAPQSLDQNSWQGQTAPGMQVTYSGYYHYTNYDHSIRDWTLPFGDAPFSGSRPGGYTQAAPADIRHYALPSYESSFVAGGTLSGNGISIDNTAGNAGVPSLNLAPGQAMSGVKVNGISGNLNITSVQDVTNSAAHQSSTGGGFTISQGGGSASFSAQNGHADSNYAGVNEQAGINAGDGGFNVNVKGNTGLTGGVISSTADESKNSLTTGTLTFNDIQNQSHYSANSNGISAGVGIGATGKAVGPGSVSNGGGVSPMLSQNESGDESATTRSAISAGAINVTNGAGQPQDIAGLSRDTAATNGTVAKTPNGKATSALASTIRSG